MQKTNDISPAALLGYDIACKKANAEITKENDRLKAANLALPEAQRKPEDELGLKEPWTADSYREQKINDLGFNYLSNNADEAAKQALTDIAAMSPQKQVQVFTALGLADVAAVNPAIAAELALDRFKKATWEEKNALITAVYPEYGDAPPAQSPSKSKKGKK